MDNTKQPENRPRKQPINPRKYIPAAALGLTIMAILGNLLILSFLPRQAREVVVVRSEILAHTMQEQSAAKLSADLKATQTEQEILNRSLPTQETLLEVIQYLEGLKEVSNLKAFTFGSDAPIKDTSGLAFLPLTVTIQGTPAEIATVLDELRRSTYLFTVDTLIVESPKTITEGAVSQVGMRLYVNQAFTKN